MTKTVCKHEPDLKRVMGDRASILVIHQLVEALADPFTEVSMERSPEDVCPLCGGSVQRPTRMRKTWKCRGRGADYEQTCGWTGDEPAREVHLHITAITRAR